MKQVLLILFLFFVIMVTSGCAKDRGDEEAAETTNTIETACSQDASCIKDEITKANNCQTKDDCVQAHSTCPFGCNVYVNEKEKDRIDNLIASYESDCRYKCAICEKVECVDNKCQKDCSK